MPLRPKLRSDLVLAQAVERGQLCIYVRDPLTHRFFRLGETARLAVERMDGSRTTSDIARELSEHFGVPVPPESVEALTQKLSSFGFLEGQALAARQRIRGNVFYLIIPLLDPERWMERLLPLWRVLVSGPSASVIGLLIALGAVLTVVMQWRPGSLLPEQLSLVDLVVFYAAASLAIAGHELAHAATLKRFGGQVHEMGFLLLYFNPCFYCNVSDAYLLERRKRLWISFAGIYFELGLWGGSTVLVFLLGVEHPVGRVAAMLMAVVGLRSVLLNLNPLIKLDGYYLLVDLVEIPNLRQRAFEYLLDRLSHLLGRRRAGRAPLSRREAMIFLTYSLCAVGFLGFIFGFIVVRLMGLWEHPELNFGSALLVLFGAFLLLRAARVIYKIVRRDSAGREEEDFL